jgi:pilus assembly protein Flp/PilA
MNSFSKLLRDDGGATAIEYGLIAALVSVAIIGVLTSMSDSLKDTFNAVSDNLAGGGGEGGEGG